MHIQELNAMAKWAKTFIPGKTDDEEPCSMAHDGSHYTEHEEQWHVHIATEERLFDHELEAIVWLWINHARDNVLE